MLDRPHKSPRQRAPSQAALARRRARTRRYRQRARVGRMCITVEVDAGIIDMLCRLRWLPAREFHERREIAAAIGALLAAAARD
jgi:hypothetical protein